MNHPDPMRRDDRNDDRRDDLAGRLRRAAAARPMTTPAGLAERTLLAVRRDADARRQGRLRHAWLALAAALVVAVTLGISVTSLPPRSSLSPDLALDLAPSPWQAIPDSPLAGEWRRLQQDADQATRHLLACMPLMGTR